MRLVILAALPVVLLASCGPDNGGYDRAPPADAPSASSEAPSVPAESAWSGDFNLIGTEPFWGVEIRPTSLTLTRPDAPPLMTPNPGPTSEGDQGVWATSSFIVRMLKAQCSDGMSDRVYAFTAMVTLADGGTLRGCAAPPKDFSEARP